LVLLFVLPTRSRFRPLALDFDTETGLGGDLERVGVAGRGGGDALIWGFRVHCVSGGGEIWVWWEQKVFAPIGANIFALRGPNQDV
jgi:hypothetical protein